MVTRPYSGGLRLALSRYSPLPKVLGFGRIPSGHSIAQGTRPMRFWKWYDRAARVDFGATIVGWFFDWKAWIAGIIGGTGGGITYLVAAIRGRDPLDVTTLALVVAAALIVSVYFGISLLARFNHPEKVTNKTVDEHVPLHVAAAEAYGATRGTIVSKMAESRADPKLSINVLTWYAIYMAVTFKAPIYGYMRFSPKREQISLDGFTFSMDGDKIIAKEIYGNLVWERLTIKRSDLDRAIQRLQELAKDASKS
jgi:hypothetical protein